MWQPEPDWERLPGGYGTATQGVWRAGPDVVVKRLTAPLPGDPAELSDPESPGWWRREADVALSGVVEDSDGLRGDPVGMEEDDAGITLTLPFREREPLSGLYVARSLGRFAGTDLGDPPWLARGQLRSRLARVAYRGGWRTLARTSVADVAEHLWSHRAEQLARLDALPQVSQHGDPVPGNLVGPAGEGILALDWGTLGTGPVGADLGYWSLSAREEFEPLLEAYLDGLPAGLATADEAASGARITAAYTVLTRAEWALARAADGDGALAGKFRHPSVAPYLLALQRQFPQIEALLA